MTETCCREVATNIGGRRGKRRRLGSRSTFGRQDGLGTGGAQGIGRTGRMLECKIIRRRAGRWAYFKFNFKSGKATIAGFRRFRNCRWTLGICH